ncbi:SDR family NAD(P)-dependent oxidoreductase [Polynucleobacter sp. CS-Odin-A6]|uniref:SDR family NAD(P)-dependent oxidoreductase n=1 Tax=Polynucleobacter sp. CS-Odin-A6 TaxID=2689106 RepID=UPI001C0E42CB|nr:SDR family oxidoreductase [Polynucleobacter sp. CS-Odin-A6]MBU3621834.1 SDR family oxidoreductase [Polynucleobacter sp. CS-Odin-A6]
MKLDWNPFTLNGKRILVTGASSGLGYAIAIGAARMGAEVVGVGRDAKRLQGMLEAVQLISDKKHAIINSDLLLSDAMTLIADALEAAPLDGVVHCAGISRLAPIRQISLKHLREVNSINLEAPLLLTQTLLSKNLINKGGSILFISSIAAHIGVTGVGIYSGSKAFLIAVMRCLALEVIKRKIRVNCLSPALVDTPLLAATSALTGPDSMREQEANYPLGFGTPEDVANACIYFLSDASKWVTGTTLIMDGGLTIG